MKSFLKFIVIFCSIMLLSCLLAPILFKILPFKFEKIFNRLVMIFSLASIAVFVRVDFSKLASYGLRKEPGIPNQLFLGFAVGAGILTVLTFIKIAANAAYWDLQPFSAEWILKPLTVLFSAFLIGLIEEVFFRGFLFNTFTDKWKWNTVLAVIAVSLFYSIIHFVSVKKPYIGPDPGFSDSLKLLVAPLASFGQWQELWRAAVGLFIFGVVLNMLVLKTRSLFVSIGLHAGCVFFVKIDGFFVEFVNDHALLWGSGKMYDSISGWIFLVLIGGILMAFAPRGSSNSLDLKRN